MPFERHSAIAPRSALGVPDERKNFSTESNHGIEFRLPRKYELSYTDGLVFKQGLGDVHRRSQEGCPHRAEMWYQSHLW